MCQCLKLPLMTTILHLEPHLLQAPMMTALLQLIYTLLLWAIRCNSTAIPLLIY
ncbi:hypothetical protein DL93DRAFT_2091179 [Clavulina sp. PMI_390]|nr:hypothetical protein DL93DRAFT_2091179 [Clavulina sp. PMI_390]